MELTDALPRIAKDASSSDVLSLHYDVAMVALVWVCRLTQRLGRSFPSASPPMRTADNMLTNKKGLFAMSVQPLILMGMF